MKKTSLIAVAALAATMLSCSNDDDFASSNVKNETDDNAPLAFTARCSSNISSRANNVGYDEWKEGDEVVMGNWVYRAISGGETATFERVRQLDGPGLSTPTKPFTGSFTPIKMYKNGRLFIPTNYFTNTSSVPLYQKRLGTLECPKVYDPKHKWYDYLGGLVNFRVYHEFKNRAGHTSYDFDSLEVRTDKRMNGEFVIHDRLQMEWVKPAESVEDRRVVLKFPYGKHPIAPGTVLEFPLAAGNYKYMYVFVHDGPDTYCMDMGRTHNKTNVAWKEYNWHAYYNFTEYSQFEGEENTAEDGKAGWVILWDNGPRLAKRYIGAPKETDTGKFVFVAPMARISEWGDKWRVASKPELEPLLDAKAKAEKTPGQWASNDKVMCKSGVMDGKDVWVFRGAKEPFCGCQLVVPDHGLIGKTYKNMGFARMVLK